MADGFLVFLFEADRHLTGLGRTGRGRDDLCATCRSLVMAY